MFCVVGSGPAGVACAHALLRAGAKVTLLDAGLELEPQRRERLAALQRLSPRDWDQASLSFIRDGVTVAAGGIPMKLAYGSRFPYREPVDLPITRDGVEGQPSFAQGGLSNVWGASVLPFRTEDMNGWPITAEDLKPHYRAVLEVMPFSARHDRLEAAFPLYHDRPGDLNASSQAAAFLGDLEAAHATLLAHGVRFGASRLAVQGSADGRGGCVYCAQCMYGCPYGYIYNSSQTLDRLRAHPAFDYRPGALVEQVSELGAEVELRGRNLEDGTPLRLRAEGVFLACGALSTARVLLASLEAYEHPVQAADNCYFLLPLLRYRQQAGATRESLHTLAHVFLEIVDPEVGPHTSHLQIYTYNELFREQVRNLLGPAAGVLGAAVERALLGRMLLIQGYLHSDLSPGIRLTLQRGSPGHAARLALSVEPNATTRPALAALQRRLWAERRSMRAIPLSPAMRVGKPGRGFHTGGTFPMRSQPKPFETDSLGRPYGFSRVHLVDASVFPTLPATTITLSVMANAHRIGAGAAA
ncbi:GMC family oxidoreductase [bacterium]|nr:MAG: GMC family oxidoreductase [bacterium]